ncbi:MAG: ABC transporter permease [Candidatus Improbicoccus devescovinae]|nr:MAG: ABC transporter permease [Candidatus Improbicoccus devescovinae]
MFKLFMSDFYKLFRQKMFYFYLLSIAAITGYLTMVTKIEIQNQYGNIDIAEFFPNINAFSLCLGFGFVVLPYCMAIFMSCFICSDLQKKTILLLLVKGISRIKYYLSKLLVVISIILLSCIVVVGSGFLSGWYFFNLGTVPEASHLWSMLSAFGLFVALQAGLFSVFTMLFFIVKNVTVGAIISILLLFQPVMEKIFVFIYKFLSFAFNIKFDISRYWIGSRFFEPILYLNYYSNVPADIMRELLIIAGAYFLVCNILGIIAIKKYDVK